MTEERFLGLDIGEKRIGVAVSDLLMITAQGIESYTRTDSEKKDLEHFKELCRQYNVRKIVCGLPLNMNGSRGPSAEKAEAFGNKLSKLTGIEVVYQDERLTTMSAERYLLEADMSRKKRRQVIDKMAAVQILQTYMDRVKNISF
ncbi:MAG: Holliday junction resolvase RuvX [Clostridia bacterium]|nr:Holliday junction resolvase RuvX [Clostridia bacterium]